MHVRTGHDWTAAPCAEARMHVLGTARQARSKCKCIDTAVNTPDVIVLDVCYVQVPGCLFVKCPDVHQPDPA